MSAPTTLSAGEMQQLMGSSGGSSAPSTSAPSSTGAPQTLSAAEMQQLGAVAQPSAPQPPQQTVGSAGQAVVPGSTLGSNLAALPDALMGAASSYLGGVGQAFNSGVQQIKDSFGSQYAPTQNSSPLSKQIKGNESALNLGAGLVNTASAPIAPLLYPIGDAVNAIGDKAGNSPFLQKFANSPVGNATSRVAQDVLNAATLGQGVIGAKAASPKLPDYSAQITKEWQSPTTINKAQYNAPRAVLAKSPSTPEFLAKQGIDPTANIQKGAYDTADTAQALRDTAGKMSADTLRPSLKAADYSTPPTPVANVTKAALDDLNNTRNLTAGDREAIRQKITSEGQALQRQYPNGMSLVDKHDEQINYAKNGGYNPIRSNLDNNISIANRSLGRAFGNVLDASAPKDVPVKEFKTYLSQYYKAADYLDALNNKKAPSGVIKYVAHKGAQVLGAAAGEHVTGGILGGVGGYMIGGALEHAVENLSNPLRSHFLQNLQKTNPEAFTAVQKHLNSAKSGNPATLKLPPQSRIQLGPAQSQILKPRDLQNRQAQITPTKSNISPIPPKPITQPILSKARLIKKK